MPRIALYPKHKKIRIGYFSADFREHPVAALTAELYEIHDRSHFEIYAFSYGPETNDKMNFRIKAGVDYFHDVRTMSYEDVAMLARSLEIDIAVDLGGPTTHSRTGIFAMSAAPIQASYIGYIGTLGANYYDYLVADQTMIPEEQTTTLFRKNCLSTELFKSMIQHNPLLRLLLLDKMLGFLIQGLYFVVLTIISKLRPLLLTVGGEYLKKLKTAYY